MSATESAVGLIHGALRSSLVSTYRHSVATVVVSVGWVLASLPIVTVGVSTLAVYAAVRSLRTEGHIDRRAVARTLSAHWLNATLLSGVWLLLSATTLLYIDQFLATGSTMAAIFAVATLYLSFHYWIVLVAAFVALTDGADLTEAVTFGYRWSITRPVAVVLTGTVTAVLFVASALLTIVLVLAFPALVATFHTELVASARTA